MKYALLGLLALVPTVVAGQGTLLTLPTGGPSTGAGETRVGEASAYAPFQNPAAMMGVAGLEAGASVLRFSGRTAPLLSVVVPIGTRLRAGFYGSLLVAPDPLVSTLPGETPPTHFGSGVAGVALAAGTPRAGAGLGAKVYTEDFGSERATWLAFDAGVRTALAGGDLVLAASAQHYGTRLDTPHATLCTTAGSCAAPELPSALRVGGTWQAFSVREAETNTVIARLRLRAEGVSNAFDASTFNAGLEVEGFDVVTLRAGHVAPLGGDANDTTGRWTFGAGVRFDRLVADVALLPDFGFGTETGVSFGVRLLR